MLGNRKFTFLEGFAGTGAQTTGTLPVVKAASAATASGNWLDAGNATGLQVTKNDTFILGGWIKWNDTADSIVVTKGDDSNSSQSYGINLVGSTGILQWGVTDTVGSPFVSAPVAIVSGVAAFFLVWADATTIKIQINGGTIASTNFTRANTSEMGGNFVIFNNDDATHLLGFKGTLDEVFFCKNPPSLATALTVIGTDIYRAGSGTVYSRITPATKIPIGLVSWWGFDEASGATRKDQHGSNNLTLHGTISQVSPLIP